MDLYYVNHEAEKGGQHRVHKLGCDHFPYIYHYLGPYAECQEALDKARDLFPRVESCRACCAPHLKRVFFDRE